MNNNIYAPLIYGSIYGSIYGILFFDLFINKIRAKVIYGIFGIYGRYPLIDPPYFLPPIPIPVGEKGGV